MTSASAYSSKVIDSPVGKLKIVASGRGLVAILWENDDPRRVRLDPVTDDPDNPFIRATERQLDAYFDGTRDGFDVPLDFKGTPFQQKVWAALLRIPYGETRTYGELAREIGHPSAARAVGAANGKNPISIIAPCHRVIGSTGKLTGFAGGLAIKEHLLSLERRAGGVASNLGYAPQAPLLRGIREQPRVAAAVVPRSWRGSGDEINETRRERHADLCLLGAAGDLRSREAITDGSDDRSSS